MRITLTLARISILLFTTLYSSKAIAGCGDDGPKVIGPTEVCYGDTVVLRYYGNGHCDSYGLAKRWLRNGEIIANAPVFNYDSQLLVTESGEYSLECYGSYIDRSPITVTIHHPLELEEPFFQEQEGLLIANHLGFHYQWLFNGVEIPDATSDSLHITEAGDYQLILTDFLSCNTYASSPLGISDHYVAMLNPVAPLLFPIPNAGDFTMRYAFPLGSRAQLVIVDATGQVVGSYSLEGEQDQWEFSCPYLASGIYHYKVLLNGSLVKAERLLVTR